MAPLDAQVALTDKYRVSKGAALMNGMQALVRLALEQADVDRDAGLKTGGYISGYRGSPIGGFDQELMRAAEELNARNIVFNPGLNEDLAATAISGTQSLGPTEDPSVEGVFSIWYGKGPGVDRSLDAMKHAALAGAHPKGGTVYLLGDDPMSKSSTTAHQSEQAMMHVMVPVLVPSSVHEIVPLGLHAIAMSRHTGAVTSLKILTDVADSAATVALDRLRPSPVLPPLPGFEVPLHNTGGFLPYVTQERRMAVRMQAVMDYARANRLNEPVFEPSGPKRLGIVAVGKAYGDAMAGLKLLDLDPERAAASGIGLFRMRMAWPVEPASLLEFVQGYDQVLVIEEKRSLVETELAHLLVNAPTPRPIVTGKKDAGGSPLVNDFGELSPEHLAEVISREASDLGVCETRPPAPPKLTGNAPAMPRTPWYCAGCPHNRSTKLPDGSLAGGGIGCHAMSVLHSPETTQLFTQMGGEGMHWVGRANFAGRKHMFQNLGDGTYTHSGMLAIKAAVAAKGVNITYKILYNDAVAMTGGQPVEGSPLPAEIAAQVLSIGAKQVVVVSDDIEATKATGTWPSGAVTFRDRSENLLVQTELREVEGTTVLLYVQTCAAEKRRRRKRGKFPDPAKRAVINPLVCEGCGDCGIQSNCVAIKPLDTPFGTKRRIDQTACNKDYSCVEGFCPSFVTVEGVESDPLLGKKGIRIDPPEGLPEAQTAPALDYAAVITGIGGTGVVTVAAVLSMAARLEGLHALTLDQTGLSQKNGAVQSHLQIGPHPIDDRPARVARGKGRLLLACDMLVGAGDDAMGLIDPAQGQAIANGQVEPLPAFARNPDARADEGALEGRLKGQLGDDRVLVKDVTYLATQLCGDGMGANLMLVGVACQAGALPVTSEAIERAIRLNGAAVDMNLAAFRWGRWLVARPGLAEEKAGEKILPAWQTEDYDALVARFERFLTDYQSARYARRFREHLAKVEAAEDAHWPGRRDLSRLAARALHKSMAIKDEYEVARLHRHPDWKAQLARDFAADAKVNYHLAPPITAKIDPVTGRPRKQRFGPWMEKGFAVLAGMKSLRGTPLDVFGRTEERRMERALVGETERLTDLVAAKLSPATETLCREALMQPLAIKGFGPVKQANLEKTKPVWDRLVSDLSKIA